VDEQQRWLHEAWTTCSRLASAGIDVRAITAWALLGSYDWDSLMTRDSGHYEPGAFDLRGPAPRRTALAEHITALATGCPLAAARLRPAGAGWWRREERLLFGVARAADDAAGFVRPALAPFS
jgi:dTDP-4-dehydrorhamnose reductase